MTDKPPVMVPAEQAHLLVKNAGGVVAALEQGDHSVLPVRCVAERILAKLLAGQLVRCEPTMEMLCTYDDYGLPSEAAPLDPAELALIQRLIVEDSE